MKIDIEKIQQYLSEIKTRHPEIVNASVYLLLLM